MKFETILTCLCLLGATLAVASSAVFFSAWRQEQNKYQKQSLVFACLHYCEPTGLDSACAADCIEKVGR